jgi:hypothetical protein
MDQVKAGSGLTGELSGRYRHQRGARAVGYLHSVAILVTQKAAFLRLYDCYIALLRYCS